MSQEEEKQGDSLRPPPEAALPELPEPATLGHRRVLVLMLIAFVCLGFAFLAGYVPRKTAEKKLTSSQHKRPQVERVAVVRPKRVETGVHVVLPGSIQALHDTLIYPQATGYIAKFVAEIGDRVKAGQALAEVDTPALDQELDQARAALVQAEASLGQAQANRDFAGVTLKRYAVLRPTGVASQQDLDQRQAEDEVAEANLHAAEAAVGVAMASVRRLVRLKQFAKVMAPFAGTITARYIDRGTLVTSGSTTAMYRLVANDPVRVFVQVPQDLAPSVAVGARAELLLREYPGRVFTGTIKRTAGALDTNTRTLNTEVHVPNPKNELLAGMYTNVTLTLTHPRVLYELPSTALHFDAHGLRVLVVGPQNRVHFVPVTLERDLGPTILIANGLQGDERVLKLVNPGLHDGMLVQPKE
jgi:RND family efflux transporter MFP subunit